MTRYHVTVKREGKWWMVAIPELDELTQARRLSEAGRMAREVIALSTGAPLDTVEVDLTVEVDDIPDAAERAERIRAERETAARLEAQALEESRALAHDLAARCVPVRDIGQILGVTFQRAHQLVRS